ncbi:MAG: class I SAM-dependent methyltransferase [Croceivirga sp.]
MSNDILDTWRKNAHAWSTAIDHQSIPSRKYTNSAILETIKSLGLLKVADLGCGEGWLTREMTKNGVHAHGFDAVSEFIELAAKKGVGTFTVLSYDEIIKNTFLPHGSYDGVVFNFSIYQKEGLFSLLKTVLNSLTKHGKLIIQTLHPFYLLKKGFSYESQWLSDSWKGLPGNFSDGHPWYARTLEDWTQLIADLPNASFTIKEVVNDTKEPVSLILIISKK